MYNRLDAIDIEGVVRYVTSLQQDDGSFFGKEWFTIFWSKPSVSSEKVSSVELY